MDGLYSPPSFRFGPEVFHCTISLLPLPSSKIWIDQQKCNGMLIATTLSLQRCGFVSFIMAPLKKNIHFQAFKTEHAEGNSTPPLQYLLKIIPVCISSFLFVLPSRWENIAGTHTTFSTSSIEMGTHPHKEILGKLSKPEDALKGHKLLPWFAYTSTFQHHISAVLACFSPLLCKKRKLSFPRCLPVFN